MRRTTSALLIAAICGCGDDPRGIQPLAVTPAVEGPAPLTPNTEYEVFKLPPLGGASNRGSSLNRLGWVAGHSDSTTGARRAVVWRNGAITDLRTLGGRHAAVQWDGQNDLGMIVGISQTATPDTLGETWSCSAFIPFTGNTCLGFVWENGVMTPLPTLGGDNGFATGVNNRGQVVGWAETRVHDPTCRGTQVLQFRAVLWEPKLGRTTELRPLRGDSASAATAINESGQVVGISGECDVAVGRFSARHAVLWENGSVIELPNLGGEGWHTPNAINERGDVVGFSNPPGVVGGALIPHAFLWTGGKRARDLGTLQGDATSQARGINRWRQVVGVSTGPGGSRAFLWDHGRMHDLNELVRPGFPDRLIAAQDILDDGRIAGTLLEAGTNRVLAFVAIPTARQR
jgi:probable HAF family extracellular repeat protein